MALAIREGATNKSGYAAARWFSRARGKNLVTGATLRRSSHTFNAYNAQSMRNRTAITSAEFTIQGSISINVSVPMDGEATRLPEPTLDAAFC